eukprot:scaffold5417_cov129-Isochrysis_galbana.AAC.6
MPPDGFVDHGDDARLVNPRGRQGPRGSTRGVSVHRLRIRGRMRSGERRRPIHGVEDRHLHHLGV